VKKFWVLVLAAVFVSCTGFAENGIFVRDVKGFATSLEVKVNDVVMKKVDVLGRPAFSVTIPGGSISLDKNYPELPRLTALVVVDPLRTPKVKVAKIQSEIISLNAPVVPSKGNITRNIDPSTVPYVFWDVYEKDAWYPADEDLVKVDDPFIMRDVRGIRLLVNPVQYNPVKNKLRVYKKLEVSIENGNPDSKNVIKAPMAISKFFEPIYKRAFVNFERSTSRLPRLDENGRLLIICFDGFVDAIQPFCAWKTKCGIEISLAKKSQAGSTAAAIKEFIQKEYDKGGLTHILLVGDSDQIPTLKGVKENADSDPCYTKLAGNDHVPDCIISRISATTPEQVAYQVAKFLNYEQFPSTGAEAAWYKKAVGIASAEGNPTDYVRAGWLRDALLKSRFTSVDEIYDPGATKAAVTKAVNAGRSLINYIGHGSTTSWGTTYFNNSDCAALSNGWKLPLIWSVACVNGAFVGRECFCEAWMKAGNIENPKGAIAIFGSSTNQEWVPPCDVQNEIITNYTVKELYKTAGGLAMNGIMKGLEIYGTDPKGSGVMMFEQWHLFGDGTLLVRFNDPVKVSAEIESKNTNGESNVVVKVVDEAGKPVPNSRVTVYSAKFEVKATGLTNEDGIAKISVKVEKETPGFATVVGPNIIPVVDQKFSF